MFFTTSPELAAKCVALIEDRFAPCLLVVRTEPEKHDVLGALAASPLRYEVFERDLDVLKAWTDGDLDVLVIHQIAHSLLGVRMMRVDAGDDAKIVWYSPPIDETYEYQINARLKLVDGQSPDAATRIYHVYR